MATTGYGNKLKVKISNVYTEIASVKNVSGPGGKRDIHDVTALDSPDNAKQKIGGMIDEGQVSFDAFFLPSDGTHDHLTGMRKMFEDGTTEKFQIIFNDTGATTAEFDAVVTAFEPSFDVGNPLALKVTLEVTGLVDYDA